MGMNGPEWEQFDEMLRDIKKVLQSHFEVPVVHIPHKRLPGKTQRIQLECPYAKREHIFTKELKDVVEDYSRKADVEFSVNEAQ